MHNFAFFVSAGTPVEDLLDSLVYFGQAVTGYQQHADGWDVSVACDPVQRSGFAAKCKSAGFVIGGRKVRAAEPVVDYDLARVMEGSVDEIQAFIESHELSLEELERMLEIEQGRGRPRKTVVREVGGRVEE